jgi:hypothetical protein
MTASGGPWPALNFRRSHVPEEPITAVKYKDGQSRSLAIVLAFDEVKRVLKSSTDCEFDDY